MDDVVGDLLVFLGKDQDLARRLPSQHHPVHHEGEHYHRHVTVDHVFEGLPRYKQDGGDDEQVAVDEDLAEGDWPELVDYQRHDVGTAGASPAEEDHRYPDGFYGTGDYDQEQLVVEEDVYRRDLAQEVKGQGRKQDRIDGLEPESFSEDKGPDDQKDRIDDDVRKEYRNTGREIDDRTDTGEAAACYSVRDKHRRPGECVEQDSQGQDQVVRHNPQGLVLPDGRFHDCNYLITKLTILPGTTITLTTVLPSRYLDD